MMLDAGQFAYQREITLPRERVVWDDRTMVESRPRYRHANPYAPTAAGYLPEVSTVRFGEALDFIMNLVQEYTQLVNSSQSMAHAAPDYRLESSDSGTRVRFSRMRYITDNDHDVFTDYPDDPLFS